MLRSRLTRLMTGACLALACTYGRGDILGPPPHAAFQSGELHYHHRLQHRDRPAAVSSAAARPLLLAGPAPDQEPDELALRLRRQHGFLFGASDPAALPTLNTRRTMLLRFWRRRF